MYTTSDARFALVCLLGLALSAALARHFERAYTPKPAPVRAPTASGATREGDALRDGARLDPNRASAEELELLPGVGPRLAREIVRVREAQGAFRSASELGRVRGIGEKKRAKLAPFLCFGSECLEHPAQPQRHLGRAAHGARLEPQPAADVDTDDPVSRGQVVDAE